MPDAATLSLFSVAALALLLVPGPAVLYIVARSIDQGRLAGLVSVLGVGVGSLVHIVAAALGLSALLMSSALAFSLVKYLGAAYLIYLGIRKLLEHTAPTAAPTSARTLRRLFWEGVLVNALNPKTALFFFAFLPQFVDMHHGSIAGQILLLGVLFVLLGIVSDSLYALLAGSVHRRFGNHGRTVAVSRYATGSVFIGLGVATALADTATA